MQAVRLVREVTKKQILGSFLCLFGLIPITNYVVLSAVALNFQTPGEQMDLNHGRFLQNGQCGYILKPPFMCHPETTFNPENVGGGPGHKPVLLTVRVRWHKT